MGRAWGGADARELLDAMSYRPGDTIVCHLEECPRFQQRERPMKQTDETESAWVFQCPTCLNRRAISKAVVGGTRGSGRSDSPWAVQQGWNVSGLGHK